QGVLAQEQRLQHPQGRLHQAVMGVCAAQPAEPFVRVDGHQRVDTIIRVELISPAAGGREAAQAGCSDGANLHGLVLWVSSGTIASSALVIANSPDNTVSGPKLRFGPDTVLSDTFL